MREVIEALLDDLRAGRRAVVVTIIRSSGSTPRTVGAKMLVRPGGETVGTIGGGLFEATVTRQALSLLDSGGTLPETRRYSFTESGSDAVGMACGGSAEVLLESVGARHRLVVFGAGHVGLALARLASTVGFRVQLVDDRPDAAEAARRAGASEVFLADSEYAAGVPDLDPSCFVAVVTRGFRVDRFVLRRMAGRDLRYVGLIGSLRKRGVIYDELVEKDGVDRAWLDRIRCPIGLPIGGDTPDEIAVSIVAELLQVVHGG